MSKCLRLSQKSSAYNNNNVHITLANMLKSKNRTISSKQQLKSGQIQKQNQRNEKMYIKIIYCTFLLKSGDRQMVFLQNNTFLFPLNFHLNYCCGWMSLILRSLLLLQQCIVCFYLPLYSERTISRWNLQNENVNWYKNSIS